MSIAAQKDSSAPSHLLRQMPRSDDALGSLYAQQQEWTLAGDEFRAALHLDPELATAHLHLGLVF